MRIKGFTLIELLVTLAVAIILATVAVPNFYRMIATNRIVADYNEVLSGLNFARSEAIKRRSLVQFSAADNGSWEYVISVVDGDDLRVRRGRDGKTSLTEGVVVFNALGRREDCDPADCIFIVSSDVYNNIVDRGIQVNVMGRVDRAPELEDDAEVVEEL